MTLQVRHANSFGLMAMERLLLPVLCLLLCVASFAQSRSPQKKSQNSSRQLMWQKLLTYEGRDLQKLSQREDIQLNRILDAILPSDNARNDEDRFLSYFFGKIQLSPQVVRYVLVEGEPLIIMPGESRGRVHIFNADGNRLADEIFQTGWRINIDGGRLIRDSAIGVPVIELFTGAMINGRDVAHQYYGVLNDHVVLIRLEDNLGNPIRNTYTRDSRIGPEPPERTEDEWEKALMSDDPIELLAALMWAVGIHGNGDVRPPPNNAPRPYIGKSSYADLRNRLRRRETVRARLNQLQGNRNQWIRQAAELAIEAFTQ